ncbi:DUF6355 family natural product biosynthesis protein [Saccharothrix sp. Mg75]|uniref:DUF6355 family natural product biosynthesis protein n=1 Tax=Saccharothrix sp. Mg75 TaxID=3445357 RepID=UPI003EEFE2AE
MRKAFSAAFATVGAAVALTVGLTAPAAAAPARAQAPVQEAAPAPCGSFGVLSLYYNHCGTTRVVIWVDQINVGGFRDFEMCVGPGETEIGPRPQYIDAWYNGKLC